MRSTVIRHTLHRTAVVLLLLSAPFAAHATLDPASKCNIKRMKALASFAKATVACGIQRVKDSSFDTEACAGQVQANCESKIFSIEAANSSCVNPGNAQNRCTTAVTAGSDMITAGE